MTIKTAWNGGFIRSRRSPNDSLLRFSLNQK